MHIVERGFFVVGQICGASRNAVLQKRADFFHAAFPRSELLFRVLSQSAHGLYIFFFAFGNRFQIREREFHIDSKNVAFRIYGRFHFRIFADVHDVGIVEAANNVRDDARFANVRQKLISQTFAFRRAFYETSDVNEFDGGESFLFGRKNARQKI